MASPRDGALRASTGSSGALSLQLFGIGIMSSHRRFRIADSFGRALITLFIALAAQPVAAAGYTLTDLGVLVRVSDDDDTSRPYSISNSGQIALTNRESGAYRAFRYAGASTNLGTLGGNESIAAGIDAAGQVVGRSKTAAGLDRAFLWTPGGTNGPPGNPQMRDLGTLPGGAYSEASAINAAGQIVGHSQTGTGDDAVDHAFRWSSGTMTDLGAPVGLPNSYAYAINSTGNIVGEAFNGGFSRSRAFVFDGTMRTLGTLGGQSSTALAINNQNQIVGYADTLDGYTHAFLYDGTMHDLDTFAGIYSVARGINNSGEIVGSAFVNEDDYHAFIRQNGVMRDLNSLLDASAAGWVLEEAYAINDLGQIIGTGSFGGQTHGFLLSPNLPGDINRDRQVNRVDLSLFAGFFGTEAGATWETGDFDGDKQTSLLDLRILKAHLTTSNGGSPVVTGVPEPPTWATAVWAALGAVFAWRLRRRRRRVLWAPMAMMILGAATARESAAATLYGITDLGPLLNAAVVPPDDAAEFLPSRPYTINAGGQVAMTNQSGGEFHAYRYDNANGTFLDLGTLGGDRALAFGINATGQVVGRSLTTTEKHRAFVWTPGGTDGVPGNPQMIDLGTLANGDYSEANAINASGQVVGYSATSTNPILNRNHAFLYANGAMRDLGGMGAAFPNSFAYAINSVGNVAGEVYNINFSISKGFFYDGAQLRDIGNLGGMSTSAVAINDSDHIVGWSEVVAGPETIVDHAFLYDGQSMRDLGTLGGNFSYALGINNLDAVVGIASVDPDDKVNHAFLYDAGMMHDLNALSDVSAAGWVLEEARAINDSGQIIGVGNKGGQPHGFLLTPLPSRTPGDINVDGTVDRRDVADFTSFLGAASADWEHGNFDTDQVVSLLDLSLQQSNLTAAPAAAPVTEPCSSWLGALAALATARRALRASAQARQRSANSEHAEPSGRS
jgi:probable HAF family extracellular repeat protein